MVSEWRTKLSPNYLPNDFVVGKRFAEMPAGLRDGVQLRPAQGHHCQRHSYGADAVHANLQATATVTGVDGSVPMIPQDSVVLETQGMTFPLCTPNGGGFGSGATCGSAGSGSGPIYDSFQCPNGNTQPRYLLGVFFRNFNPSGVTADTTFDLSDPGHEEYVTMMLNVEKGSGQDYYYCTAPALDADGGTSTAASGKIIVHQFVPAAGAPMGDYSSDVEVQNAVIPPLNGGPRYQVVSAHLYF